MSSDLSKAQKQVLRELCDTFVPSIRVPNDPGGFWARSASDLGVDHALEMTLSNVPEDLRNGLVSFLDALTSQQFESASQGAREMLLSKMGSSPETAKATLFFQKQTVLLAYGLPEYPGSDPNLVTFGSPLGQNPNWEVLGYPGPITVPKSKVSDIQTIIPSGKNVTIEADVCIVGSGAGGSVIAAVLAERGYKVLVLEMGNQYNSGDFHQLELWGYKHLWYKGGTTPTADGTVNILAGATLGGGTEINWMNCVRTPNLIRASWASEYGLAGVDTNEFEDYLNLVEQRLSVGSGTALFNSNNLRLREGCQRLGYLTKQTRINWNPVSFQPLLAAYSSFGDQSGAKQTSRRTYLLDAYRNGARFIVNCRADRILTVDGHAVGVAASYLGPEGQTTAINIRAAQVVVACGALESPALLLRSGIGGPAVGRYLRLQPGGAVYGVYNQRQKCWWGSPQTANCEEFADTGGGFGYFLETPAFGPGFYATVAPWESAREHKELMTKVPYMSTFIWFLRDKGWGNVTIDHAGNSLATYKLEEPTDQKNFRHATATAIRIHEAAGAQEIYFALHNKLLRWHRHKESLERFIEQVLTQPLGGGVQPMISAHQLGSCRAGIDPTISVADTNCEVYGTKGIWIGDGSAFPTALGVNPMITIMAFAHRTANRIVSTSPLTPPKTFNARADRNLNARGNINIRPEQNTMVNQIVTLTAREGKVDELCDVFEKTVIPIIMRYPGFVNEVVLVPDIPRNQVMAMSFWETREALENFLREELDQITDIVKPLLAGPPSHSTSHVAVSTKAKTSFDSVGRWAREANLDEVAHMTAKTARQLFRVMTLPLALFESAVRRSGSRDRDPEQHRRK